MRWGHVDLVLQRVAQDAVVPLGEVRDAVGDVVDGGGEVSEVLRVDAVSGHGGVADLLLQVEPAGGIDGVTGRWRRAPPGVCPESRRLLGSTARA